jgi:hypothetical protein
VGEGDVWKGVGGEYGGNIMYSCMEMEKWDQLRLSGIWGGRKIKENNGWVNLTQICYKHL